MRTTLDIDEDVLIAVRERAAREQRSLGAVLSALARDGLRQGAVRGAQAPRGRYAVLPRRDEIITLEHVNALRDGEGV